jgi:hypothetical protein
LFVGNANAQTYDVAPPLLNRVVSNRSPTIPGPSDVNHNVRIFEFLFHRVLEAVDVRLHSNVTGDSDNLYFGVDLETELFGFFELGGIATEQGETRCAGFGKGDSISLYV